MKKLFMLAVALPLAGVCWAQKTPPAKSAPPAKFSMSMIEGDRIQSRYAGVPLVELINVLEKFDSIKKGEFESSADFDARKSTALAGKFLGGSSIEGTFGFVLPFVTATIFSGPMQYKFNADTGDVQLFVAPKSSSLNGIGAPNHQTSGKGSRNSYLFDVMSKVNSTRTYQASNAYGASVTVDETTSTTFGIATNRLEFIYGSKPSSDLTNNDATQFHLANAKAANELPAMKALVVMKLADPYVLYHYSHTKPTRESPSEYTRQGKYLNGDILGVVFYSGLTGEVFARVPENFGKPAPEIKVQ